MCEDVDTCMIHTYVLSKICSCIYAHSHKQLLSKKSPLILPLLHTQTKHTHHSYDNKTTGPKLHVTAGGANLRM